jgi:DNA-binding transcriptional MerR regulator
MGVSSRYTPRKQRARVANAVQGLTMAVRKSTSEQVLVPEKLYFRIGEVSELCALPAHVLRFWESEFPQLKPVKSSTGQRMYRQRDVESVLRIKQLLYHEGFTIPGARERLKLEAKTKRAQNILPFPAGIPVTELRRLEQGLKDILGILSRH